MVTPSPTPLGSGPEGGFEEWEFRIASLTVRDFLEANPSFLPDREDLLQECLIHWWTKRRTYSTERGASPTTFMRKVIRAKLADIRRRASATKRGGYTEPLSLDAAPDPEGRSLADQIADEAPGGDPEEAAWRALLKPNIECVLPLLTARQRRVAQELGSGLTIAEISRSFGLSRSTLYDEIQRIRKVFRDQGLEEFVP